MTTVDPPAWITRLHQAQARRGERCRRCGHRKVIDTEAGPHCAAHAAQLPPPIVRRDHDLDLEHDLEHDDHDLEHDLDLEHEDLECMESTRPNGASTSPDNVSGPYAVAPHSATAKRSSRLRWAYSAPSTSSQQHGPRDSSETTVPRKPMSVCSVPGCPVLTRSSRCNEHKPVDDRPSAHRRGYDRAHRRRRERTPRTPCVDCGQPWQPGMHLDHVDGNNRNNHPSNLAWRCPSCHAVKTAKLDGSFGRPRRGNDRCPDDPPPTGPVFA